jgi:1-acyl-sn-glycerol-3-phosphate acyltransferase
VSYTLARWVIGFIFRVLWRPRVVGRENIPHTGPVILASNHLSFIDSVVIPVLSPRKVVFLAKEDYFTGTGVRGALMRGWFEALGTVPVDRDDTKSALGALDVALEVLARGEAFGIYPEGARSRDGRLYRGRTGVAHLALSSGAPVVPVGLVGTEKLQPIDSRLPRLAKITVRFGEPLDFAGRFDGVPLGKARRVATDEIMTAIHALSGQPLAGIYNDRKPVTGA